MTTTVQAPGSETAGMSEGQVPITGGSLSLTVTVKVQALVLPLPSVAVQVTVVVPLSKVDPLAGSHTTEGTPQLSLALGSVQVTTAVQTPRSVF